MEGLKCDYCGEVLTEDSLRIIAEAEEMTVADLRTSGVELMCDKCAEGEA